MSYAAFRHEAFLYANEAEFLDGTTTFIRDAVEEREPVLVVVDAAKIAALQTTLDGAADHVHFADMASVGRNPARIIPAWRAFVEQHGVNGRGLRGIGEPIWVGRSTAELDECHQHEALLNLAFADAAGFWLLCPYDASHLDPAVIEQVHGTHPFLQRDGEDQPSPRYHGVEVTGLLAEPLPDPPGDAVTVDFGAALAWLRHLAARQAGSAGWAHRTADVVLVVGELATNSLRHGGGGGTLSMWLDDDALVCEVRDRGHVVDPLIGRRRPVDGQFGGRGLWVVNQLCDLVQVRSFPTGTTVRVRIGRTSLRR